MRQELHGTLAAKGWDKVTAAEFPNVALEAYRGLESLIGRNRIAVPKDAGDVEAFNAIYSTLGRPPKADGYKLEGLDPVYAKALAPEVKAHYLQAMYDAGIGEEQALKLFKANESQFLGAEAAKLEAASKAEATQINALALDWGEKLDANKAIAQSAVRALGLDEKALGALETGLGYDGLYKFLHGIGTKFGEHGFVGKGEPGGFGDSPQHARAEIDRLAHDKEFQVKLQHRDPRVRAPALEQWEALHKKLGQ